MLKVVILLKSMNEVKNMLISMKKILNKAFLEKYAVGQFNIHNLEWTKAVLSAAQAEHSPVILGVSGGSVIHMGGFITITNMVKNIISYLDITVPVILHLDHGATVEACCEAIDAGFSSVMYDGSHLPFAENMKNSKRVIDYAKLFNVSVELELGTIAGTEDGVSNSEVIYANPAECILLCELKPDAFAPALGSTHGLYKGKAKLGFSEMEHIANITNVPLVLHGGTGISENDMLKAISLGTSKINVNTEYMYLWCETISSLFKNSTNDINDPRKVINAGCSVITKKIQEKMVFFGSNNKA